MSGGKIEIITDEALREVSVGRWEGLSFAEIRERWPELYEARGENMSIFRFPAPVSHRAE